MSEALSSIPSIIIFYSSSIPSLPISSGWLVPGSPLKQGCRAPTSTSSWRLPLRSCHGDPLPWKDDLVDYFTLEDLWEHYSESSAYGLSVPVRLQTGRIITQHFVPYLSAVQIYTAKTPSRSMGSETDDSWSDDSIADKFSRSWDAASDDSSREDFDCVPAKQAGYLNFQYREWDPPYERIPLADKVAELAEDYPCLTSLNSAELAPSSWLSVAWYPIYHIPYHGNLKGISACFLTYHSISSVFQDRIVDRSGGGAADRQEDGGGGGHAGAGADADADADAERKRKSSVVCLSPFGLATYRMEGGDIWRDPAAAASDVLYWAALSWLKQLGAHHPDFNFFTSRRCAIR